MCKSDNAMRFEDDEASVDQFGRLFEMLCYGCWTFLHCIYV